MLKFPRALTATEMKKERPVRPMCPVQAGSDIRLEDVLGRPQRRCCKYSWIHLCTKNRPPLHEYNRKSTCYVLWWALSFQYHVTMLSSSSRLRITVVKSMTLRVYMMTMNNIRRELRITNTSHILEVFRTYLTQGHIIDGKHSFAVAHAFILVTPWRMQQFYDKSMM